MRQPTYESVIFRYVLILGMILLAAAIRIVPHPWNLTPVGAMALFSGAAIPKRALAFVFPLTALLAGDALKGFHILLPVVYVSFAISVEIGIWLGDNRSIRRLGGAVLLGAVQFFLITNFAVWGILNTYPKTFSGLMACYAAGLPLFRNTLAGDAIFSGLLFGVLFLAERSAPRLRAQTSEAS